MFAASSWRLSENWRARHHLCWQGEEQIGNLSHIYRRITTNPKGFSSITFLISGSGSHAQRHAHRVLREEPLLRPYLNSIGFSSCLWLDDNGRQHAAMKAAMIRVCPSLIEGKGICITLFQTGRCSGIIV